MAQGCFRPTMGVPDEQNPTGHDAAEQRCHILEILPQHILLEILRCLDAESLCFLAQTCHAFLQICGLPPLWPGRRLGGPLIRAVRYSLSTVLRVPPQMFAVRLEEGRSSKFPVSVPLHNLRSILGAADVDFLAERTSGLVQDLIARNPPAISYCPASASGIRAAVTGEDGAQEAATNPAGAAARGSNCGQGSRLSRPSAALLMCRADRGFVRLGLRPGVAVARVLLAAPFFTALHRPPRAEQLIPPQPGPGSAPVPPRHTRNTDGWSAESVASATASETVICAMQQRSPASSDSRRDAGSGCGGGDRLWDDVCNASELGTGPSWDVAAAPAGANQTLLDQLLGLPPACLRVISSYCCRCGGGDSGRDSGRDDSRYHCDNCSSDATTRSSSASINGTLRVGGAIGSGAVSSTTSTSAYTGRVDCQDSPRGWKSEGRVSGRGSRPLQGFIDAVVGDNESSASGSNGSSAGCKGGDAGKGRGKCSAACRSSVATGAHVAALTAAAVASQEVAQLQLLELALAGVPYAVAAWQDFVAGCQQVAAARLRVAATAAAPLGSTANDLPPYPAPQPLLAVAAEVEAEQDQGGVDASDALGKGLCAHDAVSPYSYAATTDARSSADHRTPSFDHGLEHYGQCHHRFGLLGNTTPPFPRSPNSSLGSPGGSPLHDVGLYRLCTSIRLRLLALALGKCGTFTGTSSSGVNTSPDRPGLVHMAAHTRAPEPAASAITATTAMRSAVVAAPRPVASAASSNNTIRPELARVLETSRLIALAFGKLLASVEAARERFDQLSRDAATATSTAAIAATVTVNARSSEVCYVAAAVAARDDTVVPGCADLMPAAALLAALDAAIASATCAEANLCLTTSEALLEVRSEITAALGPVMAAMKRGDPVPSQPDQSRPRSSALPGSLARCAAAAAELRWKAGDSVVPPSCTSRTSCEPGGTARAGHPFIQRLLDLLSTCFIPAVLRVLSSPTRYSPLGVVLPAGDDASSGNDGGMLGPAAGAARLGASLAVLAGAVATDRSGGSLDTTQREALRGLLLSYLLHEMTWALECLGAL